MSETPHTPAILRRPGSRADLLVFEIVARIHKADVETMAGIVDQAIETFGEIDILLVFAAFDGASLGAVFDAQATRVSLRSNAHVRRYGVVGAPMFAEAMINLFDPVSPVDARTFDLADLDAAKLWINAPPSQPSSLSA